MSDFISEAFLSQLEKAKIKPPKRFRKELEIQYLPTGIIGLDIDLGGGYPRMGYTEIFGAKSSGKTQTALISAGHTIKHGAKVVYIYLEMLHVDVDWARQFGVNFTEPDQNAYYFEPKDGTEAARLIDLTIENAEKENIQLLIIDSTATFFPSSEQWKDMDDNDKMGANTQMLSQLFRRMGTRLREFAPNLAVVGINQQRQVIGAKYKSFYAPGGEAKDHALSISVRMDWPEAIEEKSRTLGKTFAGHTTKNKTANTGDGFEYEVYFQDGQGKPASIYAPGKQLVKYGTKYGVFTNKSDEVYTGAGEIHFQGRYLGFKDKEGGAIDTLNTDEELAEAVYQAIDTAFERSFQDADPIEPEKDTTAS